MSTAERLRTEFQALPYKRLGLRVPASPDEDGAQVRQSRAHLDIRAGRQLSIFVEGSALAPFRFIQIALAVSNVRKIVVEHGNERSLLAGERRRILQRRLEVI